MIYQWFSLVTSSLVKIIGKSPHSWPKMVIHANSCIILYFLNENLWIMIKISLKFLPKGPNNNIPALVQIMAWRQPGDKPWHMYASLGLSELRASPLNIILFITGSIMTKNILIHLAVDIMSVETLEVQYQYNMTLIKVKLSWCLCLLKTLKMSVWSWWRDWDAVWWCLQGMLGKHCPGRDP